MANSNLATFLTELSLSYIVLALVDLAALPLRYVSGLFLDLSKT